MTFEELKDNTLKIYLESDIGSRNILFNIISDFEVNYKNTEIYDNYFIHKIVWHLDEEHKISVQAAYVDLEYFNVNNKFFILQKCIVFISSYNYISYEKRQYYSLYKDNYDVYFLVDIPSYLINYVIVPEVLSLEKSIHFIEHNLFYYKATNTSIIYKAYRISYLNGLNDIDKSNLIKLLYNINDVYTNFIVELPFYDALNEFLDINIVNKEIILSLSSEPKLIPLFDKEQFKMLLSKVKLVITDSVMYKLVDNEVYFSVCETDKTMEYNFLNSLDAFLFRPYVFESTVKELEVTCR